MARARDSTGHTVGLQGGWACRTPGLMSPVTLGLIQMHCSPNPAENLARALARVEEAARRGARIACLPELFRSRYFCQIEDPAHFELAEPIPGPSIPRPEPSSGT